jgi:hypothetical protein
VRVYGMRVPKEGDWEDRGLLWTPHGLPPSRSWKLVVANPGRTRGEQRHCAEGGCRLAQNCLASFWVGYFPLGFTQRWVLDTTNVSSPRSAEKPAAMSWSVNAFIEALQQASCGYTKDFADPQQSGQSDRPSGFNLLPVSRGEAERDHVLLAETSGFPQFANFHP